MDINNKVHTIWIISKYASAKKYGFDSRLFALAREFKKKGRKPIIISSDSNHFGTFPKFDNTYTSEVIDGCEVWWIKTIKYTKTVSVKRILSWLDFEFKLFFMPKKNLTKPDVLIVSTLSLLTILNGIWFSYRYDCKLVFEVRDIWPLTLVEEGGFGKSNPFVMFLAWVERFGYRNSDLIIGTMPNLSSHVKNVAGNNLLCRCVPFGFDPTFFDHEEKLPNGFIEKYIPNDKFVIGYAGSMGITNALDTVIECAKQMANDDRFFFVFLGDGDLREKYILDTNSLSNVVFIPKVKRTQVQSLLRFCDLLYFAVLNSPVWHYGMSLNKLIDYMMAAKPIVASYSGYPSMLNEANCGVFVPSGDIIALKKAFNKFFEFSTDKLVEMGMAGRKWLINNRNWDTLAQEYLVLCDKLYENSEEKLTLKYDRK